MHTFFYLSYQNIPKKSAVKILKVRPSEPQGISIVLESKYDFEQSELSH